MMLMPIVAFFEVKLRNRIIAILVAYLVAVVPLFAVLFFFFNQSRILFGELPSIRDKLSNVATRFMEWFNQQFNLDPETSSNWISENLLTAIDIPIGLLEESFQSGTSIIANIILIILITYFMLLYRTAFKNFVLSQINPIYRKNTEQLFEQLQKLVKRYMIGQGLVIIILGLLIGSGLWIIGVPYPFFWGFLAGFLELIPYVGTTIGAILPFTYMLIAADTLWQPWAVLAWYIVVQQLEGNLISPNVMGASIKINPLFIIIGLFLGAFIWGISGMVLALPILAISKEVFRSFDVLAPISYLMEDGLSRKSDIFLEKFDKDENRFFRLFFKDKNEK
ncbi:AI-2E family transporter [Eudoraea adriatica]|uniref:AI-2E family transporter n=1 Tax=Eudoraea adriatica TaxID=446681 RepID=UPI0029350D42|nr:AI-2E family transporter [Eudoraea adriatica]